MLFDVPLANLFFRNIDGNIFAEGSAFRGINDFDGGPHGACFADLDNDSDYDLINGTTYSGAKFPAISNIFRNNGNGTFTFNRSFSNIEGYMGGFADLNNDIDLDLVFAGNDICYLNDGTGNFTVDPTIPVSDIDDPRTIGFADIDDYGDLDFAVGYKRSRNWLIRNDLDSGNWLKVRMISPQS